MDNLRTELDQLEDARLAYVMARSKVNSDRQGYLDAGIAKATFYLWPTEEREKLNDLAQRVKRETATRAIMVLQDAAEDAAVVKAAGLKSRDERVKQAAATEILDRTIGKTTTTVALTGSNGQPIVIKWDDSDD